MRIIRKVKSISHTWDESSFETEINVYSLHDGGETHSELYADIVWAKYMRHCVKCPYKIPERSLQYRKV